jgi:hypothetical protein
MRNYHPHEGKGAMRSGGWSLAIVCTAGGGGGEVFLTVSVE